MPNGGAENCGTCGFNLSNEGKWGPPGCGDAEAFCSIRILPIPKPYWTYCANWASRERAPEGPAFSSGLYEDGYTRLPRDDEDEPRPRRFGRCCVCDFDFERGLTLAPESDRERQFCSNAHYLRWWKQEHPQVVLKWEYRLLDPRGSRD